MTIWDAQHETIDRERLEALQLERLQGMLARIYERVPFYRARLDDGRVRSPATSRASTTSPGLPFTEKNDFRDEYPYGPVRRAAGRGASRSTPRPGPPASRWCAASRAPTSRPGPSSCAASPWPPACARTTSPRSRSATACSPAASACTTACSAPAPPCCPSAPATRPASSSSCRTSAPPCSSPRRPTRCTSARCAEKQGVPREEPQAAPRPVRRRGLQRGAARADRGAPAHDGHRQLRPHRGHRARAWPASASAATACTSPRTTSSSSASTRPPASRSPTARSASSCSPPSRASARRCCATARATSRTLTHEPCACGRTARAHGQGRGPHRRHVHHQRRQRLPLRTSSRCCSPIEGVEPFYQIVLDRVGALDTFEVHVEVTEALFDGWMDDLRAFERRSPRSCARRCSCGPRSSSSSRARSSAARARPSASSTSGRPGRTGQRGGGAAACRRMVHAGRRREPPLHAAGQYRSRLGISLSESSGLLPIVSGGGVRERIEHASRRDGLRCQDWLPHLSPAGDRRGSQRRSAAARGGEPLLSL